MSSTDIHNLYVVDHSSVEQMTRIREHLSKYYKLFMDISYIDGAGNIRDSCYDIWINLCLTTSKVRPAFMVQWVDYIDPSVFEQVMSVLTSYRDNLEDRDIDYRLLFITDSQGVIVTTYYTYYKNNLNKLISDYSRAVNGTRHHLLGLILGYPAAGEITLHPGDFEYLDRDEQPPGRHTFSLFVSPLDAATVQIFGNVYRTPSSRSLLYEFYNKVVPAINVYDPQSKVLVEDSQGSLVPPDSTYDDSTYDDSTYVLPTPEMEEKYYTYINSPERSLQNWNTDFDRIFEIGFFYGKHP